MLISNCLNLNNLILSFISRNDSVSFFGIISCNNFIKEEKGTKRKEQKKENKRSAWCFILVYSVLVPDEACFLVSPCPSKLRKESRTRSIPTQCSINRLTHGRSRRNSAVTATHPSAQRLSPQAPRRPWHREGQPQGWGPQLGQTQR